MTSLAQNIDAVMTTPLKKMAIAEPTAISPER